MLALVAFSLGCFIWFRFLWGVNVMSRITDDVYIAGDNTFDIVDCGLSDNDIDGIEVINGNLRLYLMVGDLPYIEHTKDDAIAIAKALGVTGEDLK